MNEIPVIKPTQPVALVKRRKKKPSQKEQQRHAPPATAQRPTESPDEDSGQPSIDEYA